MLTVLQQGPWFINGLFLSVKKWHPNFVASEATENHSAIWIQLPELPTEYYDHLILSKIGSKLGRLVKTDILTSSTLRERYARICIKVPLGVLVKTHIYICCLKKQIVYGGADILRKACGMLGHTVSICPTKYYMSPKTVQLQEAKIQIQHQHHPRPPRMKINKKNG